MPAPLVALDTVQPIRLSEAGSADGRCAVELHSGKPDTAYDHVTEGASQSSWVLWQRMSDSQAGTSSLHDLSRPVPLMRPVARGDFVQMWWWHHHT